MYYPVLIEPGNATTAWGMQVPDIPGAVTAGDTFEEAWKAALEVSHIMLEELAAQGQPVPMPSPVCAHQDNPDFAGMGVALLDIDVTPYLGTTEKVNVTLPASLIARIDAHVRKQQVKSRSAFLAQAALEKLTA